MSTALYRHYDREDRLLYVGITDCLSRRTKEHTAGSEWFKDVVRTETTYCIDRAHALDCELVAIKHEKPLHNKEPGRQLTKYQPPVHVKMKREKLEYQGPPTREQAEFKQVIGKLYGVQYDAAVLLMQFLHLMPEDCGVEMMDRIGPDRFLEVAKMTRAA